MKTTFHSTAKGLPMSDDQHISDQIRTHLHQAYNLDDDRIEALLPGFLAALSGYLDEMDAALTSQNRQELVRAVHRVKGALVNLGLEQLAGQTQSLEATVRQQDTNINDRHIMDQARSLIGEIRSLVLNTAG